MLVVNQSGSVPGISKVNERTYAEIVMGNVVVVGRDASCCCGGLPSLYDELSLTGQTEVEETKEEREKTERGSGTTYI